MTLRRAMAEKPSFLDSFSYHDKYKSNGNGNESCREHSKVMTSSVTSTK